MPSIGAQELDQHAPYLSLLLMKNCQMEALPPNVVKVTSEVQPVQHDWSQARCILYSTSELRCRSSVS
ncbi:unnamed protein product [Fusarium graminearum]|nr:unnamed protein product [Fusarium graminearum]CAG1978298.1 unnamed protein product [Fusarium graminearum]